MATYDEVKRAMDAIANLISTERKAYESAKARIEAASAALGALGSQYQDVLVTIDGYTPNGAFETLAKDEKAKLISVYSDLKGTIDGLIAATEFTA